MNITFTFADANQYTSTLALIARPPLMQFYRQPHDEEIRVPGPSANLTTNDRVYRGTPTGTGRDTKGASSIPEVYLVKPDHAIPLSTDWADFVCDLNPDLSREMALKIFDPHWAFNNGRTTPGFDKPRLCGGALLHGTVDGTRLMIDGLLTSEPIPDPRAIIDKPWLWYWATAVGRTGNISYMRLDGCPVRVPILSEYRLWVPLSWLHRLPAGYDAASHDPLKMWM